MSIFDVVEVSGWTAVAVSFQIFRFHLEAMESGHGSKAGKQLEAFKSNYEDEKRWNLKAFVVWIGKHTFIIVTPLHFVCLFGCHLFCSKESVVTIRPFWSPFRWGFEGDSKSEICRDGGNLRQLDAALSWKDVVTIKVRGTWEQEHCDVERASQQYECRGKTFTPWCFAHLAGSLVKQLP